MFRFRSADVGLDVDIEDKLDIICPRRGRDKNDEFFFFKLYIVSEENFNSCSVVDGRKLLTCNVPAKEKKYTFFFQEISPSPWGLEFKPGEVYYVICKFEYIRVKYFYF